MIASAISESPSGSALLGDFELLRNLLLVLPAETEAVGPFRPVRDLLVHPLLVGVVVLAPRLPLAGVVGERSLVHHRDALRLGADRFAHPAAAARKHVGVIEAVRRDVE